MICWKNPLGGPVATSPTYRCGTSLDLLIRKMAAAPVPRSEVRVPENKQFIVSQAPFGNVGIGWEMQNGHADNLLQRLQESFPGTDFDVNQQEFILRDANNNEVGRISLLFRHPVRGGEPEEYAAFNLYPFQNQNNQNTAQTIVQIFLQQVQDQEGGRRGRKGSKGLKGKKSRKGRKGSKGRKTAKGKGRK